jgi:molecular chaperone DnaK (HSP70)
VTVAAGDYYEGCRPLVDRTVSAVERLIGTHDEGKRLAALYVTGGGSELPLVARMLREVYGRRVKRSAYTRSATAIGLAIQADAQAGYSLRETFTRHFGVWRESEAGRTVTFDSLFDKGTPLPAAGQRSLVVKRTYVPVHNVGHFRYLECSHRSDDGRPLGDISVWDEIRFPFDPALRDTAELGGVLVAHSDTASQQLIEEKYSCDAAGSVTVRISNLTAEYSREYRLARWAAATDAAIDPTQKRRPRRS